MSLTSDEALAALRAKLTGEPHPDSPRFEAINTARRAIFRAVNDAESAQDLNRALDTILVTYANTIVAEERKIQRAVNGRDETMRDAVELCRYMFNEGYTPDQCINKVAANYTGLTMTDLNEVRELALPVNETRYRHDQRTTCGHCGLTIHWDADMNSWWVPYKGNPVPTTLHCADTELRHAPEDPNKKEN